MARVEQTIAHRHVLASQQFDPRLIQRLFVRAEELQLTLDDPRKHQKLGNLLAGRLMFTIFYEPSTRTRISFAAAGQHLGMQVIATENAREFSSAAKGETIEDTIRVLCQYRPDVIVLRHHETGAAERAAKVSTVPILNAGDGTGQHPTQALLDLYTIQQEAGRLDNLKVVIGGDLAHGRTARSLVYLLAKFPSNEIIFTSPESLKMNRDIIRYLKRRGMSYSETADYRTALKDADVVYWTRIQKERFEGAGTIEPFVIGAGELKLMKKDAVLLHPLPRVDEITTEVDNDPRSAYFRQAGNGMFIRMALIEWTLGLL